MNDRSDSPSVLRLLTLNLAHGRGRALHQWFLNRARITRNLDRIAEVLKREHPDIVTLQEAEGESTRRNHVHHVEYLAEAAGYAHFAFADHVTKRKGVHGTAILSRLPLSDPVAVRFDPSPPTPRKGLVMGRIAWPGRPAVKVEMIAVHLDFLRGTVRRKQVEQILARLADRNGPRIIMGDFNCQWCGRDESLRLLARELGLRPCQPTGRGMLTYPRLLRRLDWILVSPHFEFTEYRTLPDRVSDHRPVLAVLSLAEQDAEPERETEAGRRCRRCLRCDLAGAGRGEAEI